MNAIALAYSYDPASGPAPEVSYAPRPKTAAEPEPVAPSKLSLRVSQLLDRIDCRQIQSEEDWAAVGRLRYDAYLREGAIDPHSSQSFNDTYDEERNAWTFGFYVDDELASSIRIHVASKDNPILPSLAVFPDLLEPELAAGKTIVDPTRFVTNYELSRRYPTLLYVTLRLTCLAAEYFEADHLLAAVRPEHQAFYRRVFAHVPICEPRSYPMLMKPIALMTAHYPLIKERMHRRFAFLQSTYFERRMLFERQAPLMPAAIPLSPYPEQLPLFAQ